MRKLLLSILALALLALPLQGALVTVLPFFYPSPLLFSGSGTILIDGDVDEIGFAFVFPATGTMTQAAVTTGTVTTPENTVPFRIETVGADGNASGTLYHANATGTGDVTTANAVVPVSFNSGTGFPCTRGDIAILRWKRAGGALFAQFRYGTTFLNIAVASLPGVSDYNVTAGTTWTRAASSAPWLALNIGGWIAPPGCIGGLTGITATEAFQSPVERGLLVNSPVSARAVGVAFNGLIAAATSIKLSLYSDHLVTPDLETATAEIDTDMYQSAGGNRAMVTYFTAPETLTANTDYIVALSPQGATNVNLAYYPSNNTYAAAYPTGSTGVWYARADASSAFAPTATRLPVMALIVDQIDTGSSGGKFISDLNDSPLDGLTNFWLRLSVLRYRRMLL